MLGGTQGAMGAGAGLTQMGRSGKIFLEEASAQLRLQNCLTFTLVKWCKDSPDGVEHLSTGPE